MVFEDFLNKVGKRKIYSLFLGIIYVLISYGTAQLFFPEYVSISMIFFITLLLVPSTAKLIGVEERFERKDGTKNFFRDHYTIMEIFLFLFIGIFIGYLIIGSYSATTLSYQNAFLEKQGVINGAVDKDIDRVSQSTSIFLKNTEVIVILFLLSIFYGVGALFLIVLNASVFSSFILGFSQMIAQKTALSATVFSLHFVPEVFGFLLAAIAGGVISKAIVRERMGSSTFRNVIKDGTIILAIALIVILVAALLESFVTPGLVNAIF